MKLKNTDHRKGKLRFIALLHLTLFLSLSVKTAEAQNSWTTNDILETVNSFPGQWCCVNGGYIYGTGMDAGPGSHNYVRVLRKRETGQSYETRGDVTTLDPSFRIYYRIFGTSTPGLIFIPVINATNNFFLLKSSDGGTTFSNVFAFGEGNGPNGTNTQYIRLLRGVLELTRELPGGGGLKTLYIGEYNVASGRIPGSTNDRVRIMKSVDNGSTWTKVVEWNTNGSNQVGHIHAMKQDPYTGEIYICVGDGNTKAGIIKWDGVSPWSDNKTPAEISTMRGFKVLTGLQRYRVCDVLFDNNHFYTFTDTQISNNPTGSESGIWRGTKNFENYTRVDNQIYNYDPMHIGWFGEKIGNTLVFTTAREYEDSLNTWKQLNTRIYTSNDGVNWHASGTINWRDRENTARSQYIANVFSYNNRMYIDCYGAAGHSSTIQCEISGKWKSCDDPVILHPVFFVGEWNSPGNDHNAGTNADNPKMTLNNILSSNRISAASRVRLSAGIYNEAAIYPQWSGSTMKGKGSVVIEGKGKDQTHIVRSGSGSTYGIMIEAARTLTDQSTPFIMKDLDICVTADGGAAHSNYVINNVDSYVKTIGCRIGNRANDDSPLIRLSNEGAKYVSENTEYIANGQKSIYKNIVQPGAANTAIHMKNCIILNGHDAFVSNYPGIDLRLSNCTFHGIEHTGVLLQPGSNMQPDIKNCIFTCGETPISDLAGLPESGIDYNIYNKPNINVTDGGHSLPVGTDPMFTDGAGGDFNLRTRSPAKMSGLYLADVQYDYASRPRPNPPCIGAFENPALKVNPSSMQLPFYSGSTGSLNITSNTSWSVTDNVNWLILSSGSGTGNQVLNVTAATANSESQKRLADIVFSSPALDTIVVRIIQSESATTDNQDVKDSAVIVYPNPVSGVLTIKYKDDRLKTVSLMNMQGVVLSTDRITGPVQQIDFSGYLNGVYILEFANSEGEFKRVKIINR